MKIRDVMSRDLEVARPEDTLQSVAERMASADIGSLPVEDGGSLVGMITDRDIVIRAVAKGLDGKTTVSQVMTREAVCCQVDDDLIEVSDKMANAQIRRLPVLDESRKLVGIVALGDLALQDKDKRIGETLEQISEPGRPH
jgi:CBS domain-containing protein